MPPCDAAADPRPPAAYLPVPNPTSPTRPRREKAYDRATRHMAHEVPAPSKEEQPATHDLGLQVRAVDVNVAKAAEAPPV